MKAAMRAAARVVRDKAADPQAGEALAGHVLAALVVPPGAVVAGVWPLPGELDLRPLLHAFFARGISIALPQTPPLGQALRFRAWSPGCTMLPERFGTACPDGPELVPDIIFVPLLAWDRAGHRLGYGGGYYDRTLAALPGRLAIGFGYAAQEVPHIPVEPHDQKLQAMATEQAFFYF